VAAPPPDPKSGSGGGVGARLTAKVGPFPVWLWAALILGAYLLYTRLHPGTATAATTAATTATDPAAVDTSGAAGGVGAASFDPSGLQASVDANTASSDANASSIDAIWQLLSLPTADAGTTVATTPPPDPVATGAAPGGTSQAGPASAPTPAPAVQTAAAGHLTQTTPGLLSWGGQTFTTKAAFNQWAQKHGTTAAAEFKTHPQAKALYAGLR
jgi:hypothetical protein